MPTTFSPPSRSGLNSGQSRTAHRDERQAADCIKPGTRLLNLQWIQQSHRSQSGVRARSIVGSGEEVPLLLFKLFIILLVCFIFKDLLKANFPQAHFTSLSPKSTLEGHSKVMEWEDVKKKKKKIIFESVILSVLYYEAKICLDIEMKYNGVIVTGMNKHSSILKTRMKTRTRHAQDM